jgi:O-acetyl-ADP-ribose deacetylase (regulator of RNase III)
MSNIIVHLGDITKLKVDAMVNAANERMLGGGGVDGAIHKAAGPKLLRACKAVPEVDKGVRCPVGHVRVTPAFDLPAKFVFHTVGPMWNNPRLSRANEWQNVCQERLSSCYRNVVQTAEAHGLKTVSIPAISTGIYGFPEELAAERAVSAIADYMSEISVMYHTSLETVYLVAFDKRQQRVLQNAVDQFSY